jgi:hypothetical protein
MLTCLGTSRICRGRPASPGADGHFTINRAAANADIARSATGFISLEAKGDATAIKSLLQRYVVVTPAFRDFYWTLWPVCSVTNPCVLSNRTCMVMPSWLRP